MNAKDLPMALENARIKTIQAINQIQAEVQLPAYLYEGVLCSALAEVRNQKMAEMYCSVASEQVDAPNKEDAE